MQKRSKIVLPLVLVGALGLVAAACGSDSDSGSATTTGGATTTAASGATTTAAGGATTTAAGGATTTAAAGENRISEPCKPDPTIDAVNGKNAGQFTADIQCAAATKLKAEGEPIVVGLQNPQGDPAGSFPEFATAVEAATKYINEELGGLGSNPSEGRAGRPIKLETCFMAINPADSQKCANELAGKKPFTVLSSLNFFGNHFPIYNQAGINVVVGTPITVGDFTAPDVFSIGAGGGCLGAHTAAIHAATQELKGKRVAVPWADTPPGVVCYYDLEKKPLDVLQGSVPGDSELAGSIPDLEHIGVPVKPASPDVTPQVTQVLDFDPDVIVFSGQGADCWNLVDGLGRLGWTPDKIPLILTGSCIDLEKMIAAGPLATGVYFIGTPGANVADPASITDPRYRLEALQYTEKAAEYGMPAGDITKGFGGAGWNSMMTIWEQTAILVNEGKELTPDTFKAQIAGTSGNHIALSVPFGCAEAPVPYTAVCNSKSSLIRWVGDDFETIIPEFTGIDLVAGTELKPGP